jgi:hypothetical protein
VHVAQVLESGAFFIAHAAGEIRISQALVAGGFGHILQDTELLANHLLAVPGHLLHTGQDFAFDVIALLGSEAAPGIFFFAKVGALRGGHAIPLIELLANFALFVGREILERPAILKNLVALTRAEGTHLVNPRASSTDAHLLTWRQFCAVVHSRAIGIVVEI